MLRSIESTNSDKAKKHLKWQSTLHVVWIDPPVAFHFDQDFFGRLGTASTASNPSVVTGHDDLSHRNLLLHTHTRLQSSFQPTTRPAGNPPPYKATERQSAGDQLTLVCQQQQLASRVQLTAVHTTARVTVPFACTVLSPFSPSFLPPQPLPLPATRWLSRKLCARSS